MTQKERLIQEKINSPFAVGDRVWVKGLGTQSKNSFYKTSIIVGVLGNKYKVEGSSDMYALDSLKHYTNDIGINPFPDLYNDRINNISFSLESILFGLGIIDNKTDYHTKGGNVISYCNWNPFIISANGEKKYYQRPFVWSMEDNQNLIESIYQNIDCGKILIRNRSFEEADKMGEEASFKDIVDGKQRLNAIRNFMLNVFPDYAGNYWADLSANAQRRLLDHQLFSYAELPENTKDESVIRQFLKLNFCGIPQSNEHIEFVKSIKASL
ncbi:MAG TPA: DUF262 domain-containing protein [Chitinophagaceae bacterium]